MLSTLMGFRPHDCSADVHEIALPGYATRGPSTTLSLASRPPTPLRMTELGAGQNPRRILGGQNPKATPSHRLQQRRGSAAPPAGTHLSSVILSGVEASGVS